MNVSSKIRAIVVALIFFLLKIQFFSENTFMIQNSLASRYNHHNEVGLRMYM